MRLDDFEHCFGQLDIVSQRIDHRHLAGGDRIEPRAHHIGGVDERTRRGRFFKTVVLQQARLAAGGDKTLRTQSINLLGAGVIQLAVAPVFLLAAIAGLLNVMSTRLGPIIDRARIIERRILTAKADDQRTLLRSEATTLWQRIALINWGIRLCVTGALTVCLVIVALFVGAFVAIRDCPR